MAKKKRPPGRPKLVGVERKKRHNFILHPELVKYLTKIGAGNRSAGLTLIVADYRRRFEDKPARVVEDADRQVGKTMYSAMLYPSTAEYLTTIGSGNRTAGLVAAVREYRRRRGDQTPQHISDLASPV